MLKNKPKNTISIPSLTLLLFLATETFTTTTAIWPFKDYTTVQINNYMSSKAKLQVHCKDKNHDFGIKELSYLEMFSFKFELPFMLVAQYFCDFTWDGNTHSFDIYVQTRDSEVCEKVCDWLVVESGPCLHNQDHNDYYNKCYHWDSMSLIDPVGSYPLSQLVNQTDQP